MATSLFVTPSSMSTTSKFARAFSIRDKKATSLKPSTEPNLFSHDESSKKLSKDEQQKVQDISLQLSRLGNNVVPESRIQYALRSKSAQGDVKEAMRLLLLYEDSIAGVLRRYDPRIKMLGAENWEKTTCWLDALLFAMFAQTDVFEAVLHKQYEDEERKQLVNSLRLWVNMLRSGKLIPIDLVRSTPAITTSRLVLTLCPRPDAYNRQLQSVDGQKPLSHGNKMLQKLLILSLTNYPYLFSPSRPTYTIKAKKMPTMTTNSSPKECLM